MRYLNRLALEFESLGCPFLARRLQRHLFNEVRFAGTGGGPEPTSAGCLLTVVQPQRGLGGFLNFNTKDGRLIDSDIRASGMSDAEIQAKVAAAKTCRLADVHHHLGMSDVHLIDCTVDDLGAFMQEMGY